MESKELTPAQQIKNSLAIMAPQFESLLPESVSTKKFIQVVQTTILSDQNLLNKDRASLFKACLQFAEAGIMPNGRDGAIVGYGSQCNAMFMIGGLRKIAMQTGAIDSITSELVYKNDTFKYKVSDSGVEFEHAPDHFADDRGDTIGVYCLIRLKDGGKHVEVMTMKDIESIKACSKGGNSGPWVKFFSEMAIKSVTRRALKKLSLPDNSGRLDVAMESDNDLYEMPEIKKPVNQIKDISDIVDEEVI